MLDTDIAYTAGLLDGEGSISLAIHHGKVSKNGLPNRAPLLLIQLTSTDQEVITWLYETWGVGSVIVGYRPKRPNHRTAYAWRVSGGNAAKILEAILPFLRIKRRQAELGIQSRSAPLVIGKKLGEEEMRRRLAIRDEMIQLNNSKQRVKKRSWNDE